MKVSYNWLKDYVDVSVDPKKLAYLLTMAGTNVASWENIGGDYVFDFEITANRPDCLSVLGIAREIAALLGKRLKLPKELEKRSGALKSQSSKTSSFDVRLKDPELCPRYTARIIRDAEVAPSPEWLKKRIISAGLRPVNNIVDITNFVLLETGQPLHAFDFDRIKDPIFVRRAREGEKIITIDNVQRTCDGDMLVIADERVPLAIAGVMGGLATEVNNMTRNILLESAFFNPVSIRRTSRSLGLSSESSYRFERKIDNSMVLKASQRASALIVEIAGGRVGPLADVGTKTSYSKTINFNPERISAILGITIKKQKAVTILKSLAFQAESKKGGVKVTVPSFRQDVKSEEDLAEEIARIYGYEKIPLTIPSIVGNTKIKDFIRIFEEHIKKTLTRLGLNEIITYSLVKKDKGKGLGLSESEVITIKNPLSIDQEIMRPSMLPGMLGVISYNLKRYARGLSFFEVGETYRNKGASFEEELVVSMALTGAKREDWSSQKENFNLFDIKGILEKLLTGFGLKGEVSFKKEKIAGFAEDAASIAEYKGNTIARLGEVDRGISDRFDVEKSVFYAELHIKNLIGEVDLERRYTPYGRYPSITRDISVISDKDTPSRDIIALIKERGKGLVKGVALKDLYKGRQVPHGKKGLLYRIEYRSDEKTLEDAEVEKLHTEIKTALTERLNVSFR